MKGQSNALLEVGDTFRFNGLRGQEVNREVRLRIEEIGWNGDLTMSVSHSPDDPFRLGLLTVPILTAINLIETNVWEEA